MGKTDLIGYYKGTSDPDEITAMVLAELIRKGIYSSTEGLEPKIAKRVKELLKENSDDE